MVHTSVNQREVERLEADLRLGDCYDIDTGLRSLFLESVDMIVTSPPFNLGGDFHSSSIHHDRRITHGDYGIYKDDMPEDKYQDWQVRILERCFEVLKPGGSMYYQHKVRIKDGRAIHPLEWLSRTPFVLKQEIIINFRGTVNQDRVRFLPITERLYWLTKEPATKLLDERCAAFTDVWEIAHIRSRKEKGHPAAFDNELPRRCILASSKPGDLVVDPFMGSGTTAVEALSLGRRFLGWEIDPKFLKVAQQNVSQVQSSLLGSM